MRFFFSYFILYFVKKCFFNLLSCNKLNKLSFLFCLEVFYANFLLGGSFLFLDI